MATKMKRWTDPVVEEVRAAREALMREVNYDIRQLHTRILESQRRHGERLVRREEEKKGTELR